MKVLRDNLTRHPDDRDTCWVLWRSTTMPENIDAALEYAERLSRIAPDDGDLARVTDDLRSRLKR